MQSNLVNRNFRGPTKLLLIIRSSSSQDEVTDGLIANPNIVLARCVRTSVCVSIQSHSARFGSICGGPHDHCDGVIDVWT